MTPLPLDKLGWDWQSHKSALWHLGLLYRKPEQFQESLKSAPRLQQFFSGLKLYVHFFPWLLLVILLGRIVLFYLFDLPVDESKILSGEDPVFQFGSILENIAIGITSGIVFGIIYKIAKEIARGIALGITGGIALGSAFGIIYGMAHGIVGGIAYGITFGIAIGIYGGINNVFAGIFHIKVVFKITLVYIVGFFGGIYFGNAFGVVFGIIFVIVFGVVGSISSLRIYYQPFSWWLSWPKPLARYYRFHPVAWDDLCAAPFPGMHRLLVAYAEYAPLAGEREIERLIGSYPSQREAALHAKTILLARKAANLQDITALTVLLAQLPEGKKGYLAETQKIRSLAAEIAREQARLDTMQRPFLREPGARLLCKEIENFRHQISGFHEPLASEFRKAAEQWLQIAQQQWQREKNILQKEPSAQVFRAGDPVDRNQEAFVPRYRVVGELEKQIMLSTGCPGLVLYARRRMGKSTLLRNLHGFVPASVVPVVVSMQNPQLFTSLPDLLAHLHSEIAKAVSHSGPHASPPATLTEFFQNLSTLDIRLNAGARRLLLAVDEYENLDLKIGDGVFPQDLLATIRESIQTHRNITWIFAGSHEITELQNARWTSYLVSARTLEMPMFTPEETRLLLTDPLKHSSLWEKDAPNRPHFAPEFWGEGGIARVHREAGGWPHLVQLIAETIIDLINESDKRQVDSALFEQALDKAVVSGHNVLHQLMRGESELPGEWQYLAGFRGQETQPPPEDELIFRSLRRRLLVSEENGAWRLRVPLMARWLRVRG